MINSRVCRRRVAKLYLPPGGKCFGCRHCYNRTYESCKEHDKRVDVLAKLSSHALLKLIRCGSNGQALLAPKAGMKGLRRF